MAANLLQFARPQRLGRSIWFGLLATPVAVIAAVSWWLTAPLDDDMPAVAGGAAKTTFAPALPPRPADVPPPWPHQRIDGEPAKTILLETLQAVKERLDRVAGYTATFRKQERMNGKLGPEQTLAMKVRHRPFAIYLKFLAPDAGKEVVYAQGHHENKVIAHTTGLSRWLVPRLAVPPDHPLALAETRHSVTEAGLANLTDKLLEFRRMDIGDPEAVTILDQTSDDDGRSWLRSIHIHPRKAAGRPFTRVDVLYDPESRLPLRISNYDWPEPGHTGELLLAERYAYDDLNFDATFTALDFDPANPAYAFHRY
jgi:hypothetical protein